MPLNKCNNLEDYMYDNVQIFTRDQYIGSCSRNHWVYNTVNISHPVDKNGEKIIFEHISNIIKNLKQNKADITKHIVKKQDNYSKDVLN